MVPSTIQNQNFKGKFGDFYCPPPTRLGRGILSKVPALSNVEVRQMKHRKGVFLVSHLFLLALPILSQNETNEKE